MAEQIISFIPENDKEFRRSLDRLAEATNDFRIPFNLIANHWYRGNRKLFTLKSAGLYQDLAPARGISTPTAKAITTTSNYKQRKKKKLGFVYPILRGKSRDLENSLKSRTAAGAVFFAGRQTLEMGTDVYEAKFHQSDKPRRKIPQRKMIFIDGGPAEVARDAYISGRLEAWVKIIDSHIKQLVEGTV